MTFQSWLVRVILSALLLSWFGPDSRCTGSVWTRYASSNTSRWKDLEGGAASVRLRTRCEKPFPLDHDSAFISSYRHLLPLAGVSDASRSYIIDVCCAADTPSPSEMAMVQHRNSWDAFILRSRLARNAK
jgi:hypothetical protein